MNVAILLPEEREMNLVTFGERLEKEIVKEDIEASESGLILTPKDISIKVVGQTSLLADEFLSLKIELEATVDFDAFKESSYEIECIFKSVLRDVGMVYDDLSSEIWMPEETIWTTEFEGQFVKIEKAKPIYVIASKAIKAPERNMTLIKSALDLYGNELELLIIKHGGSIEKFKK